MAVKASSTTVISNTPDIDFARLTGVPAGVIKSLVIASTGDTTLPFNTGGTTGSAWAYLASLNPITGALTITFDTNCACACAPVDCVCQCGG